MKKGYIFTEKQASDLFLILSSSISQVREGPAKTKAKELYRDLGKALNIFTKEVKK